MSELEVRGVLIPSSELRWRFSRSSGPGGQSVNTTDSRVELSYDVASSTAFASPLRERALRRLDGRLVQGVVTVVASEHRSQWRNRQAALSRLRRMLHDATAPEGPRRRLTMPSQGARRRRLEAKRMRANIKRLRQRPTE